MTLESPHFESVMFPTADDVLDGMNVVWSATEDPFLVISDDSDTAQGFIQGYADDDGWVMEIRPFDGRHYRARRLLPTSEAHRLFVSFVQGGAAAAMAFDWEDVTETMDWWKKENGLAE